jgi:hypothetical protein
MFEVGVLYLENAASPLDGHNAGSFGGMVWYCGRGLHMVSFGSVIGRGGLTFDCFCSFRESRRCS